LRGGLGAARPFVGPSRRSLVPVELDLVEGKSNLAFNFLFPVSPSHSVLAPKVQ
jgi:hypothetical protein